MTHNLHQYTQTLKTDRRPEQDHVASVLETVEHPYDTANISAPLCNVFTTNSENIDENQIQHERHELPLTTNNQPVNDRSRIGFDRALIEEIDAAMHAQNGYRTLCVTAQSKHCHGHAYSSHVTSPVNDGQLEGHLCHVEDSETKRGKRRHRRRQRQQLTTGLTV